MRVLNTYVDKCLSGVGCFFLVAFLFLLVSSFLLRNDITRYLVHKLVYPWDEYAKHVWKVLYVVFSVMALVSIGAGTKEEIYAEATIIDEYPIGALYSKYEIKDRRGDIWVLKLRKEYVEDIEETNGEEVEEDDD